MAFLVNDLMEILTRLAPANLAEEWDNIGLQVGSRVDQAGPLLVALNVTGEVLDEAAAKGCGAILAHHPLIFRPLATVSGETLTGHLISRAHREGIAIVVAHTNLDAARGGLADVMAGLFELDDTEPLAGARTGWSKLVVFVPPNDLESVKEAVFAAGAGVIGDYQHCSWSVTGRGGFFPTEGADPAVGEVGRQEEVEEIRLEMVFPTEKIHPVTAALERAHPYEEPAHDIYPLDTKRRDAGAGRVGELGHETRLGELAARAAELFGSGKIRHTGGSDRLIQRVAVAPGSGGDFVNTARALGAQVLITGDLKYHQALKAEASGLSLIDITHDASEGLALSLWLPRLNQALAAHGAEAIMSTAGTDPWYTSEECSRQLNIPIMEEENMHNLYVDGGARGNPGPAGIGAVLFDEDGHKIDELASFIGEATNNVAEYRAMIAGLEMAIDLGVRRLMVYSDSELMVRQLKGSYKVKNEGLKPFHQQAKSLLSQLDEYELNSIPREKNADADRLVNAALDSTAH